MADLIVEVKDSKLWCQRCIFVEQSNEEKDRFFSFEFQSAGYLIHGWKSVGGISGTNSTSCISITNGTIWRGGTTNHSSSTATTTSPTHYITTTSCSGYVTRDFTGRCWHNGTYSASHNTLHTGIEWEYHNRAASNFPKNLGTRRGEQETGKESTLLCSRLGLVVFWSAQNKRLTTNLARYQKTESNQAYH